MGTMVADVAVGEAVKTYYAAQDAARRSPFISDHALADLAGGVAHAHRQALERHDAGSEQHSWHHHEHHFWRCRQLHHAARARGGSRIP